MKRYTVIYYNYVVQHLLFQFHISYVICIAMQVRNICMHSIVYALSIVELNIMSRHFLHCNFMALSVVFHSRAVYDTVALKRHTLNYRASKTK